MNVDELRTKYKDNEFMLNKLDTYVSRLPLLMQSIEEEHQKKTTQRLEVQQKKDMFILDFLKQYSFYYISSSETYLQKQDTWAITREDDIIHKIGASLPKDLLFSKYKLIQSIMKKIKETPIYSAATPYATTMVIHKIPMKKEYAKFFLTIIGDILLHKKVTEVYYLDISYKPYLKHIHQQLYVLTHKAISDVFKYKYHDHKYDSCRILQGQCTYFTESCMIEFIIAAVYLSNKYGSSEAYIQHPESIIQKDVLFLRNHTPETLIQHFLNTHTTPTPGVHMSHKDMFFLWQIFLKRKGIPSVISQQNFKYLLLGKCENDLCMNCSPSAQADILRLKHFWDTYIRYDENEYELHELATLYAQQEKGIISIELLKDIIQLEYPSVAIHGDKIVNITCSLWNKTDDLDTLKDMCDHKGLIHVSDMYTFYLETPFKYRVGRDYFEKYFSKYT